MGKTKNVRKKRPAVTKVSPRKTLEQVAAEQGMVIGLQSDTGQTLAVFRFDEQIKPDSRQVVGQLKALGMRLVVSLK